MLFHFAIQILILLSFNSSICLRSQKQTNNPKKNPQNKTKTETVVGKKKNTNIPYIES